MRMPAIRELPLAAALLLTAVAVFHGRAAGDGMIPWLGLGALVLIVALLALEGAPGGWWSLAPLAGLTVWLALSIWWSSMPARSWDYADRTFVYLLFAAIGLWLADRRLELAYGTAALLAAVALWSLGGKVFPLAAQPVIGVQSRLYSPVGLWNQLALLGDFAIPLALWLASRRRTLGTLLAFLWGVAIVLTLSRGGLVVAIVLVALWLWLGDDPWGSAMTVVAAGVPAAAVAGIAFALPGVTGGAEPSSTRWRDGLVFGALLVAGGVAAALLTRLPPPRVSRRALYALGAVVLVAVVVVGALEAGSAWRQFTSSAEVGNQGAGRASLSSNFRWPWWKQAAHGFAHHPLQGTGAGSFHVTNLRYRTTYLDVTSEPHDLPVQFLSEAGIVGFLLFAGTAVMLLRGSRRRHGADLTLALVLPAYLLHGLVDIDWDFVAVSAPAFLVAGSLVGRPARRVPAFATLATAGAAALAFGVLLLPWLGQRWADQAFFSTNPKRATQLANRARGVDPLLVEPYWALADAQTSYGHALYYYDLATKRQPQNAQAWYYKAHFELQSNCARAALQDFYKFNALDPYERPDAGPDEYREALALVNSGKPRC
jgi:hypothetical protein